MKKLYKILVLLLLGSDLLFAMSWDKCIKKYNKAKEFSQNIQLSYYYLKSTRQCLVKFKHLLQLHPNPKFTIKAMDNNIKKINKAISILLPSYNITQNTLVSIPKYLQLNSSIPIVNQEYKYFKRFNNCNGVHAFNKVYTAKHCEVHNAKNIRNDLSYIDANDISDLQIAKLNLNSIGTFKYYSMSKEGMFFNILLKESNCKFFHTENIPTGINSTLDFADLNKKMEIRSTCLAIPSNSGGGVFQNNKLVAIISKTVFKNNQFSYSIVEPIIPFNK